MRICGKEQWELRRTHGGRPRRKHQTTPTENPTSGPDPKSPARRIRNTPIAHADRWSENYSKRILTPRARLESPRRRVWGGCSAVVAAGPSSNRDPHRQLAQAPTAPLHTPTRSEPMEIAAFAERRKGARRLIASERIHPRSHAGLQALPRRPGRQWGKPGHVQRPPAKVGPWSRCWWGGGPQRGIQSARKIPRP